MDRISTQNSYDTALLGIYSAQSREVAAESEASTGYKASNIKGYAGQAEALTATQTVKSRLDAYVESGAVLTDKLSGQNEALSTLSTAVSGASNAVLNAIATGDGSTLGSVLQSYYAQAAGALNTRYQNGYLFAGGNDTAPVATSTLTALATFDPATPPTSPPAPPVFQNGKQQTQSRLDDNITITTGLTASGVASSTVGAFKAVADYISLHGPFTKPLSTDQNTFLQGLVGPSSTTPGSSFHDAANDVIATVAANGVVQQLVTSVNKQVVAQQTAAQTAIAEVTSADLAQASSNLALAQAALTASAQVFAALKSSSLLTTLTGSG